MIISEFKTIEKTILTKDKIEPQQIYSFLVQSESMPCMGNNSLEIRIEGSFCHLQKECTKITGLMNFLRSYLLWHHNAQEVND